MSEEPTGGPFEIVSAEHDSATVLTVRGELDLDTIPELSATAFPAADSAAGGLVVDLTDVSFLSSSAITVLVRVCDRLPEASRMALVAVSGVVVRPVQLSGIDRVMATFTTVPDAVAHVRSSASDAEVGR
ncbi:MULTISPECIES: STAS domain-containing protein [Nocardiaceae]|uniref:Anti-sigma factor antagonist n=1 Tax=Rhodococcoides yunnanense TaxID=278209 RepID=A0ABU4BJR7_9NOCA|nr:MULTISPECIES: STAS domain-containing protein [Rhodococcus]MDI9896963.1 STAS domain-containing protein [Rhodococcus sp. IEGM 1381]MDV6264420.1 STAS domain-containing protein [Rhodococcus yunnanensis]